MDPPCSPRPGHQPLRFTVCVHATLEGSSARDLLVFLASGICLQLWPLWRHCSRIMGAVLARLAAGKVRSSLQYNTESFLLSTPSTTRREQPEARDRGFSLLILPLLLALVLVPSSTFSTALAPPTSSPPPPLCSSERPVDQKNRLFFFPCCARETSESEAIDFRPALVFPLLFLILSRIPLPNQFPHLSFFPSRISGLTPRADSPRLHALRRIRPVSAPGSAIAEAG